MKKVTALIVDSTINPGLVSLRAEDGSNIKRVLLKAGFKAGDIVTIVLEKASKNVDN